MKTFTQLVEEITSWQDSVFTRATPLSAATHLQREVFELMISLQNGDLNNTDLEIADVAILAIGVAHLSGIDLERAIEEKMAINRNRTWGEPDREGVVEHIRNEGLDGLTPDQVDMLKEIIREE